MWGRGWSLVQAQLLLCLFLDLLFFFFSCLCHFLPFAHTGWPVSSRGFALELRALPCAGGRVCGGSTATLLDADPC